MATGPIAAARGASRRSRSTASCRRRCSLGIARALIDVSAGGALIETNHRLLPGTSVELQVETGTDRANVRGQVLRCAVVRVRPTWVCYRGAIAFDRHLPWFVDERRGTQLLRR